MLTRPAASAAALALALAACGGGSKVPTMEGREGMLSRTAIAEKCDQAAKEHDRPFVVEWDATDLASFEAKASRGTILVHYDGCKLDVLYECSDPVNPQQFGAYGLPQFTSGTVQGFDVKNEGELYAQLPLGAAKLSGRVQAGETLHLKYFVSGVATTSRDSIYRGDLERYPTCKNATHFVWGYNLGAFELGSTSSTAGEAGAQMAGVGVGASRSHDEASVGNGGSIASCSTNDQRACRVPIRLALRTIGDGQNPAGGMPPMAGGPPGMPPGMPPAPPGAGTDWQSSPAGQAHAAFMDGIAKLNDKGDGVGCLASFDRGIALDPRQFDNIVMKRTRTRCQMRAGKCEEGKKDLRGILAGDDVKRIRSDEDLDREVREVSNRECSSATATKDSDYILRAAHEMTDADRNNDAQTCQARFDGILARLGKLQKTPEDGEAKNRGVSALETGSFCVAKAKGCAAGLPMWKKKYAIQLPNFSGVDKTATESWDTLTNKTHRVQCK